MTTTTTLHPAMHRAALIAGLGLLLMAVLAGLATFGVLERVVTDGDAPPHDQRNPGDVW
jgi:hypothetical protein